MYRLISNGGRFLKSNDNFQDQGAEAKKGEYVDYEEVESKMKK